MTMSYSRCTSLLAEGCAAWWLLLDKRSCTCSTGSIPIIPVIGDTSRIHQADADSYESVSVFISEYTTRSGRIYKTLYRVRAMYFAVVYHLWLNSPPGQRSLSVTFYLLLRNTPTNPRNVAQDHSRHPAWAGAPCVKLPAQRLENTRECEESHKLVED